MPRGRVIPRYLISPLMQLIMMAIGPQSIFTNGILAGHHTDQKKTVINNVEHY